MRIDLDADLGEGDGAVTGGPVPDLAPLELVTSANVAAGRHAGDPWTDLGRAGFAAVGVPRSDPAARWRPRRRPDGVRMASGGGPAAARWHPMAVRASPATVATGPAAGLHPEVGT